MELKIAGFQSSAWQHAPWGLVDAGAGRLGEGRGACLEQPAASGRDFGKLGVRPATETEEIDGVKLLVL